VFETFKGWEHSQGCHYFEDLPPSARAYLAFIEEFVGVPVAAVSVGRREDDC
jgi:adenylosuccinate synthase